MRAPDPRLGPGHRGPASGDDWPADLATADDRARFARYAEALAFYGGDQWPGRRRRGETRLTVNYARALVRKVASYVFPAPVGFGVAATGDDAAANRAERALAELVAELDLGRLDVELCVEAAVLGDAAVKVTWDKATGTPVVAAVDPATLVVRAAPDNPRRIVRVAQRYALAGAAIGELFGSPADAAHPLVPDRQYPVK